MNDNLRRQLLAMKSEDAGVRERLMSAGLLEDGYHPAMEAVHRRNAARLREIVEQNGWPGASLVGEDGSEAAWLVLQHAIGEPDLQRTYLPLLEQAAAIGEIPRWQPAYLIDRICFFEGRPQVYGTQFDWNDAGVMTVYQVQDSDAVNGLRKGVGLPPLPSEENSNGTFQLSSERVESHRREMDAWARSVGWRK